MAHFPRKTVTEEFRAEGKKKKTNDNKRTASEYITALRNDTYDQVGQADDLNPQIRQSCGSLHPVNYFPHKEKGNHPILLCYTKGASRHALCIIFLTFTLNVFVQCVFPCPFLLMVLSLF